MTEIFYICYLLNLIIKNWGLYFMCFQILFFSNNLLLYFTEELAWEELDFKKIKQNENIAHISGFSRWLEKPRFPFGFDAPSLYPSQQAQGWKQLPGYESRGTALCLQFLWLGSPLYISSLWIILTCPVICFLLRQLTQHQLKECRAIEGVYMWMTGDCSSVGELWIEEKTPDRLTKARTS